MIDRTGAGHQQGAQAGGSKPVKGLAAWPGELGQLRKVEGSSEKKQQDDRPCPLTRGGDDGERDESELVFLFKLYESPCPLWPKPGSNFVAHQYENVYVCILYALGK